MKRIVIEKTLEVIITGDDLEDGETMSEDLALTIAREIDNSEWREVGFDVVGVYG